MENEKVSMKLVIDKKKQKVLFAEAGKDCVDFLFHVLQLPIARVMSYLQTTEDMAGSLGSLYDSLRSLNNGYIQTSLTKDCLLTPIAASGVSTPAPFSSIKEAAAPQYMFYRCRGGYNGCREYLSDNPTAKCQCCNEKMTAVAKYVAPPGVESDGGGYVKGLFMYLVTDDLGVEPSSSVTGIELLSKFNVKDVGLLERRVVTLDASQALALLKASFSSKTVLTDVFLRRTDAKVWQGSDL